MYNLQTFRPMPLFRNCNDAEINRFLTCVNPRRLSYEKGQVVHQQDDLLQNIILVLRGELATYRLNSGGQMSLVSRFGPGDVYGQLSAFSSKQRDPLTLIATSDADCLLFRAQSFYQPCSEACRAHQMVTRNMIGIIAEEASQLSEKVSYLSCATLKGKIARYLLTEESAVEPGTPFEVRHNRETLAQLLAVARPSLSRTLTQMKKEGWIDFDRNTFRILDRAQLEAQE